MKYIMSLSELIFSISATPDSGPVGEQNSLKGRVKHSNESSNVTASSASPAIEKKTPAKPQHRLVGFSTGLGGDLVRDALAAIVAPFVAVSFIIMAACEAVVHYGRKIVLRRRATNAYDVSKLRDDVEGKLEVDVFDPTEADYDRLQREYVEAGIPFIIKRKDGKPLTAAKPPAAATEGADFAKDCIRVAPTHYLANFDNLDGIVYHLFPYSMRAYWPIWFLGSYAQGKAHSDLGPHTMNCYYLKKGTKDVIVAPPEVTERLPLLKGLDGVYIPDSEDLTRAYLKDLPYYYHCELTPGAMLVFSNSSCLHQFMNGPDPVDGSYPEALSVRIKHTVTPSFRLWKHMTTDYAMWWRFTGVVVNQILCEPAEDREAKYL